MMRSRLDLHPSANAPERQALDEALFGGIEKVFDPEQLPVCLPAVPEARLPLPAPMVNPMPVSCVVPAHIQPLPHEEYPLPDYPMDLGDDAAATPAKAAVSDASGSYSLTNLAPGVYEVRSPEPEARETVQPQIPEPVGPSAVLATSESEAEENPWAEESWVEEPPVEPVEDPTPEGGEPSVASTMPELPPQPLKIEVNLGLQLAPGETARLGSETLRITGAETPFLVDLMLLSPPAEGVLLRDGFALTGGDVFTQEDVDSGRITYRHEGERCASDDGFLFTTPGGEIPPTKVPILIRSRRRAPRLLGSGKLGSVETGTTIADVLDGQIAAEGACGAAILEATGAGSWKWSGDDGVTWAEMNPVQANHALLLGPTDKVRFEPRGRRTVARLCYRAWDLSAGLAGEYADCSGQNVVGGVTAFSQELTSASVQLGLTVVVEQKPAPPPWATPLSGEMLVESGMAVVRLDGEGIWQYSRDAGGSWRDCRPVYYGRALLLTMGDLLRFLPSSTANNESKVTLTVRQWDGTSGTAGGHANIAGRSRVGLGTSYSENVWSWSWRLGT